MDKNQQLTDYIRAQHQQGADLGVLRQQLVSAGWNPHQVDDRIARIFQQPQQTGRPVADLIKPKPPIAAQVLYALSFIGLLLGLFVSVVAFIGASSAGYGVELDAFGLPSLSLKVGAVVLAFLVICLFALVNYVRSGKLWALISYTAFISIGFVFTLYDYLTMSDLEKLLNSRNPASSFFVYVLVAPLIAILWIKNRNYFK